MNGIALKFFVLQGQDVSVSFQNITDVLLKQAYKSQFELLMPSDSVGVMLNSSVEFTVLDIHSLHSVA